RVVGHVLMHRREIGDLRIPPNSIDLALAATSPEVQGSGVGSALTVHALQWAHDEGFAAITIDWRVVNLLASRFFGARGFRPTFSRLDRHIPCRAFRCSRGRGSSSCPRKTPPSPCARRRPPRGSPTFAQRFEMLCAFRSLGSPSKRSCRGAADEQPSSWS